MRVRADGRTDGLTDRQTELAVPAVLRRTPSWPGLHQQQPWRSLGLIEGSGHAGSGRRVRAAATVALGLLLQESRIDV